MFILTLKSLFFCPLPVKFQVSCIVTVVMSLKPNTKHGFAQDCVTLTLTSRNWHSGFSRAIGLFPAILGGFLFCIICRIILYSFKCRNMQYCLITRVPYLWCASCSLFHDDSYLQKIQCRPVCDLHDELLMLAALLCSIRQQYKRRWPQHQDQSCGVNCRLDKMWEWCWGEVSSLGSSSVDSLHIHVVPSSIVQRKLFCFSLLLTI